MAQTTLCDNCGATMAPPEVDTLATLVTAMQIGPLGSRARRMIANSIPGPMGLPINAPMAQNLDLCCWKCVQEYAAKQAS